MRSLTFRKPWFRQPVLFVLAFVVASEVALGGCTSDDNSDVKNNKSIDGANAIVSIDDGSPGDGNGDAGIDANQPLTLPTQFGSDHLSSPQHITIDKITGKIYVACFSGSVVVFDKDANYLATYGTSGPGKINQGVGVAVDPAGNIYVGDYGNHVVVEFDNTGIYQATFPSATSGVTLGRVSGVLYSNGYLYAVDDDGSRVLQFDASGAIHSQFATTIEGQASLAGSVGIAVDGKGHFWIADYYYDSFAEYASDGTFVSQYGTPGTAEMAGAFSLPYALTIDSHGKIYVTDTGNRTVQRFSAIGEFDSFVKGPASAAMALFSPTGVAVDQNGYVYVSDSTNNVVDVFGP